MVIIPFNNNRIFFIDLTGSSPYKSIRRNLYVVVVYAFDSNAILAKPIKNRQAATIRDESLKMHKISKSRGKNPKEYIMDNECSSDLK